MKVLKYQQKAVQELVDKSIDLLSLAGQRHTLVFEAPTGAGKTIMASELCDSAPNWQSVPTHHALKWRSCG